MLRPSRPAPLLDANTIVPGEPLIEFRDVSIGFDEGDVLRGLSFDVSPGETKVFLGESGSGKTLIMKLAAGLDVYKRQEQCDGARFAQLR